MNLSKKAINTKASSTLEITAKSKQLIAEGKNVIAFTAGEPDFSTPENIKNAGIKAINDNQTRYTAANGLPELRKIICEKLKKDNNLDYSPENIVVSNGAKQSLSNIFLALLNKGDEVLIPIPFWLSYKTMVELADGTPVFVKTKKENNYSPTIEELENCLTEKTKVLLINSPSNPAGVVLDNTQLQALADFAIKHDLVVVSDEIYEYLIYDDCKHKSIAEFDNMKERTVVVNGVSKAYAMTGWRIGYTASPANLAKAMTNIQSHMTSNPNTISQYATMAALTEENELLDTMKAAYCERRNYLYEKIQATKYLSATFPQGAFYLFVDVSELYGKTYKDQTINNSIDVTKILLDDFLVCVVPCVDFGTENHIRLSYAISLDLIKEGVTRIKDFANKIQ